MKQAEKRPFLEGSANDEKEKIARLAQCATGPGQPVLEPRPQVPL